MCSLTLQKSQLRKYQRNLQDQDQDQGSMPLSSDFVVFLLSRFFEFQISLSL